MGALVPGAILDLAPGQWKDSDGWVATQPLYGQVVKAYAGRWPLVEVDLPDGRREWIWVRLAALAGSIEETT